MKKINLKTILITVLSFLSLVAPAQVMEGLKPLKVGDKMPDIALANIFRHQNTKGGTLMSEFGGKPLIIDRWNKYCPPCVAALPFMDSLQKENTGRLNVLLVDSWLDEKVEVVKSFLTNNTYLKDVTLPTTIMDSTMAKLFPGEPYQVWIDASGIIRSISEPGQVTRENVRLFLSGQPLKLNQVKIVNDPYRDPDKYPLMVINENYNQGKGLKYYTYISGYDSTANRSKYLYPYPAREKTGIQMLAINADMFQLYNAANPTLTGDYNPLKPYQFILTDPNRFRRLYNYQSMYVPDPRDFPKLFCYQMISADTSLTKAFKTMKNDLDNFFNMESAFEKRKLPCYILRRIDKEKDVLQSRGGNSERFKKDGFATLNNRVWSEVPKYLNSTPYYFINNEKALYDGEASGVILYQVIDETGYSQGFKVDISVPLRSEDWENLPAMNAKLRKYNLAITKEDREIDVIVLKDRVL